MEIKTKKTFKIFRIIGLVIFYTIIVALLLFSISTLTKKSEDQVPNLFGLGFLTVETDSMEGTEKDSLFVGDLIFVKVLSKKDKETLDLSELAEKGMIVTFFDRDPDVRKLVTHRAKRVTEDGLLVTQGDASYTEEDSVRRGSSEIVAIYKGRISGVGKAIAFMQTPVGFGVVVVLPMALLLIYQGISLTKNVFKLRENKLKQQIEIEKEALELEKEKEREQLKKELLEELEKERMK